MTSQKSDVEKIRYQLKKLNKTATNEEIRLAIDNFEGDFDPEKIALSMVATIAINKPNSSAITRDLKTEIKALGIEISASEIKSMVSDFRDFYDDTSDYINQIKTFLAQYLDARNQKISGFLDSEIKEISSLISDKNNEFQEIISNRNSEINNLVVKSKIKPIDYSQSLGDLKNFLKLEV